jgi:putative flippase GtrA
MTPEASLLARTLNSELARQFPRFVVVGASNTAISLITYALMIRLGLLYWVSGAAAFLLGSANGYVLNRRWTFGSPDSSDRRVKYLLLQLAGLGATTALLWLFVSSGALARIEAYALALPLVTIGIFLANRAWVFTSTTTRSPRA